jgi:hypothetical protein
VQTFCPEHLLAMQQISNWTKPQRRQYLASYWPTGLNSFITEYATSVGRSPRKQGQGSALDPPKAEGLWKPFILPTIIYVPRFGFRRSPEPGLIVIGGQRLSMEGCLPSDTGASQ